MSYIRKLEREAARRRLRMPSVKAAAVVTGLAVIGGAIAWGLCHKLDCKPEAEDATTTSMLGTLTFSTSDSFVIATSLQQAERAARASAVPEGPLMPGAQR